MKKKTVSVVMLTLLLMSTLSLAFTFQPVKASETIYIRPDGSIDPSTAPIERDVDVYTFEGNISERIVIQKNDIIIDGNNFTYRNNFWLYQRNNVTIQNTKIESPDLGVDLHACSNITIANNTIADARFLAISLYRSDHNLICNNVVKNSSSELWPGEDGYINLWESDFNTITNNGITQGLIPHPGVSLSCELYEHACMYNVISNNTIQNCGIYLAGESNNNVIAFNHIRDHDGWPGIWLRHYCLNNTMIQNDIENGPYGIQLDDCDQNTVIGNNVTRQSQIGIDMLFSSNNTISGNEVTENKYGIHLGLWSNNNTVSRNNIIRNHWGITICHSRNSRLFYNNIIDNTVQYSVSYPEYSVNIWDTDSLPYKGNYWSDYSGVDNGSGFGRFGESREADDGIGDTNIPHRGVDWYPLMSPWNFMISANIGVDPDTLNLRSRGQWITSYIELPEGYNPEDIDASTVFLNETIQPVLDPKYDFVTNSSEYIVDHDGDGILERIVKFNRTEVASWICNDLGIRYGSVTLTITGSLFDGTLFEGTDPIKVLLPGDADDDGDVDFNDLYIISRCHGMSIENPNCNPLADFNEDGYINSEDLYILSGNYGKKVV